MPLKVSEKRQAWVRVPAPPKRKARKVDPREAREALCAPLRYFACREMGSKDRIRMLNRPVTGVDGMYHPDRAPSPEPPDHRKFVGSGLKYENGSHGGGGGGADRRSKNRVVSAPAKARRNGDGLDGFDVVEVIEEASTIDGRDGRSYSRTRHRAPHGRRRHAAEDPLTDAHDDYEGGDYNDGYESELYSRRSASPARVVHPRPATGRIRNRDHTSTGRQRVVTAPAPNSMPRPTTRAVPSSSSYKFESAIFQPKASTASNYKSYGRGLGGSAQKGGWASATTALSFD